MCGRHCCHIWQQCCSCLRLCRCPGPPVSIPSPSSSAVLFPYDKVASGETISWEEDWFLLLLRSRDWVGTRMQQLSSFLYDTLALQGFHIARFFRKGVFPAFAQYETVPDKSFVIISWYSVFGPCILLSAFFCQSILILCPCGRFCETNSWKWCC
jgi:hypothetical protein